ncbi:hypothetical protein [Nocardioides sp. YIM 152588]|uniref:hypothetical protein n=1 Tax=Nocardioides sp. YIM 152588 TaxID=3158259 RepID=UPI0032E4337D
MNRNVLAEVPDGHLRQPGTKRLREWLERHGLQMTLEQLDAERRRRGFGRRA